MEELYAIVTDDGKFIAYPNETGSGSYISLMSKQEAIENIARYHGNGYKVKKIKVHN